MNIYGLFMRAFAAASRGRNMEASGSFSVPGPGSPGFQVGAGGRDGRTSVGHSDPTQKGCY